MRFASRLWEIIPPKAEIGRGAVRFPPKSVGAQQGFYAYVAHGVGAHDRKCRLINSIAVLKPAKRGVSRPPRGLLGKLARGGRAGAGLRGGALGRAGFRLLGESRNSFILNKIKIKFEIC